MADGLLEAVRGLWLAGPSLDVALSGDEQRIIFAQLCNVTRAS